MVRLHNSLHILEISLDLKEKKNLLELPIIYMR